MPRGFFRMTCLLLALAVQHGVHTAAPAPQTNETWKKAVLGQLREIKDALTKGRSSCGGGLGAAVAQIQSQIAASCSATSSTKADLQFKLQNNEKELQYVKEELKAVKEELQVVKNMGQKGSTFVRWGRKTCPTNTTLVYSGVAGGKEHSESGSGTNSLCLTRSPQFDNTPVPPTYHGRLYGAEYEFFPGNHEHDVPCSVCLVPQSATIMIAGTFTCPSGWTAQYTGHLSSQHYKVHYATEYVCMDGNPENDYSGGLRNDNGLLFYYVITVCGSLPCPPYQNRKIVTCVVCSK